MSKELILVRPSKYYKKQIYEYRKEFLDNNEEMCGSSSLRRFENIEEWIECINKKGETCPKGIVPSTQFLTIRKGDNKLVGMINVRHKLNEHLLNFGGHIGYSIRKSERRKGYGKEQLRLALLEARNIDLSNVLITCNKNNISSQKTIISVNGILENEVKDGEGITQRYWISNKEI